MSWSLQLRSGDLVFDQGRVGLVTGWQKLLQDLRCHLLESLGNDSAHPDFGSILDGGVDEDGSDIPGIVGVTDSASARAFVAAEIDRIIRDHQAKQLVRAREDSYRYGKSTLTNSEVLDSAQVNIGMEADVMIIQIVIRTLGGDEKRISIPFSL